jgi:D-alanyl-D-alanine carboxypeptidase
MLKVFSERGPAARGLRGWSGRWWTLWNPVDLVPVGNRVMVTRPDFFNPFLDASEIKVEGRDRGRIALAPGYASHGEPARLERDGRGKIVEVRLGGTRYRAEARVAREIAMRWRAAPWPPADRRRRRRLP